MNFACMTRVLIGAALLTGAPVSGQAPSNPGGAPPAQPSAAAPSAAPAAVPAADKPAFKPEELEQMLASIALYPDSLLSQVLMASTYPVEVVEADRWAKANASLKGDALTKELEKKSWDASVRSLVNFPAVLSMMSESLATTVKIGDAFIGQQKEVMDTVQKLRAKAKDSGNLKTTKEQNVTMQPSDSGTNVIVIESSSPEVIYVPQYSPSVVYGSWPYPAYPPYPYYPPGYVASNVMSFGVGVACGVAWGYAMGNCNWGHGDVDIDVNRNTNFNRNIDRSKFQGGDRGQGGRGTWKHDPSHRQGAAYRNQASANRVGAGNTSNRAASARNDYRGKAEAGRGDISRGGADSFKGNSPAARNNAAGNRPADTGGNRAGNAPSQSRPSNTANRSGTANGGGAMNGASNGGASARQSSSRGASSRSASPSRSSGGGGGGRGGGGRR